MESPSKLHSNNSDTKKHKSLSVSIGVYSDKGLKDINQDFHGAMIPDGSQLNLKGVSLAIADGISSSDISQVASETAVKNFLQDYYCTPEAWTVKKSGVTVLNAANSWLYSQTQRSHYRFDKDKGYVCTFSALVLKSNTAHIFHIGDSRIYRLNTSGLELLTTDHRLQVSEDVSYLSRALGIDNQCDIDYRALSIDQGDIFILSTDGVHEFINEESIKSEINKNTDLNLVAKNLAEHALKLASNDNLTLQILRIDTLPEQSLSEVQQQVDELPLPPMLDARARFDGYTILRQVYASSRSHLFLAQDDDSKTHVILKIPSIDLRGNPAYLERFLSEEWIARRINSPYVLKAALHNKKRNFLYTVFELIDGKTLSQWIIDNPKPDLETVRDITEQISKGLQAFHRMEMLHQDLKPDNIMIDKTGVVKIVDFGSTWVAGLAETIIDDPESNILGTAMYTAPEYFLGAPGTSVSEQFSLGVIVYYMLSGRFPYGTKVSAAKSISAQRRLAYKSVLSEDREIPMWIDDVLQKAVNVNPLKRYEVISEFLYDLRHPNKAFLNKTKAPLMERNPVAFWQGISLMLFVIIIFLILK